MLQTSQMKRKIGALLLACLFVCSSFTGFLGGDAFAGSKTRPDGLTVKTDAGGSITTAAYFSWDQLNALPHSQASFSSIDSMPSPVFTAANAVTLREIINRSGIEPETISGFKITGNDDYVTTFTKSFLFGIARYYYPNLYSCFDSSIFPAFKAGIDTGVAPTEPTLGLQSYQDRSIDAPQFNKLDEASSPRLCFGQKNPSDAITGMYPKWTKEILLNIDPAASSVWLNTPLPNTAYKTGDTIDIAGRAQNIASLHIIIRNYAGDQITDQANVPVTNNTFFSSVILPDTALSGTYSVTAADGSNSLAVSTFSYEKQSLRPTISAPNDGQKFKQGTTVAFTGVRLLEQ